MVSGSVFDNFVKLGEEGPPHFHGFIEEDKREERNHMRYLWEKKDGLEKVALL
jgi:hypothetical protein